MMAAADDLATFLQSVSVGTVGTDIFKRSTPDSPDRVLVLHPYMGLAPRYVQDQIQPKYERPNIQISCRDIKNEDAEALAYEAWSALSGIHNQMLSGTWYLSVRPNGSPMLLRRDSNDRPVYGFNVLVEKEASLAVVS